MLLELIFRHLKIQANDRHFQNPCIYIKLLYYLTEKISSHALGDETKNTTLVIPLNATVYNTIYKIIVNKICKSSWKYVFCAY